MEDIKGQLVGGGKKLKTIILIHDDGPNGGSPIARATVTATLTTPSKVLTARGTTDENGVFDPVLLEKAKGTYTVEVLNIEKESVTYDNCSDTTQPNQSKVEFTITDGMVGPETVLSDPCPTP